MRHNREIYEFAASIFSYDEGSGVITYAVDRHTKKAGEVAGRPPKDNLGYVRLAVRYAGKRHFIAGHRLAWFISHDEIPSIIDHKNRVRNDNRISNLCNGTYLDNAQNRDTGTFPNGIRMTKSGKYEARIRGVQIGTFANISDAVEARKKAYADHNNQSEEV